MKLPKEIINGTVIFIGIALFFLMMNVLGLANLYYLRLLNVFFIFYGVNKTISTNINQGQTEFVPNVVSAMVTSLFGVLLCIVGLVIYSYAQGGDAFVQNLSKTFLFGGNPSVTTYSICLLFEGMASSVIVTMLLVLYWNNKLSTD